MIGLVLVMGTAALMGIEVHSLEYRDLAMLFRVTVPHLRSADPGHPPRPADLRCGQCVPKLELGELVPQSVQTAA